ncbi:MAG: hypothetical protein ACK4FG_00905 [Brevundimonas sp.]
MSRFHHIRLELAREPGHPEGEARQGYDIVAPLDDAGRLDAAAWKREQGRCRVRRFMKDQTLSIGALRHGSGGRWTLELDPVGQAETVTGFRLQDEAFVTGEYVSLTEPDGREHTYVVARMAEV